MIDKIMGIGQYLALALRALEQAQNDYIKKEKLESVAETIQGCAVAAAIAGVGSGWLPGAGSLVATGVWVATIWGMYIKVNHDLEIKIKDNVLKSLASAFLTNIIASAGSLVIAYALSFVVGFIPGFGTVGAIAIDGFLGYITVYASGLLYIRFLTKVLHAKGNLDFSDLDVKTIAKETIKESNVKDIIKEGRASFKEAKKEGKFKKKE